MNLRSAWIPALAALAVAASCGEPAEPVARLAIEPDRIELGYPGFTPLTYRWNFEREPENVEPPLRVFVHLLDEVDGMVRTFDHDLPAVAAGEEMRYDSPVYQSALAPPLTAGSYRLSAGLYDAAGNRWPLATGGEEIADGEYAVATVEVSEAGAGYPMFYFSPGWMPVEGGSDRQVLARRWRGDSGVISVAEIAGPGRVWIMLGIPSGESEVDEMVMSDGATVPEVTLTTTCGGFSAVLAGPGSHQVTVPVEADADGAVPSECEIGFDANFYVISLETLVRRTIALENLSWAAG